ncbi:MAG: hypothetical protein GY849_09930 [Deltaproteobacteria bacterium]|nr:hypothetical protein [Deltaproteobacteria bacterium]
MKKLMCLAAFLVLFQAFGPTLAAKEKASSALKSPKEDKSKIVLSGKLFCSLKRHVTIPYKGVMLTLHARSGQRVKEEEVLVRYRLDPEVVYDLRQKVLAYRIKDLEMKLAQVEKRLAGLKDEITKRMPLESAIKLAEVEGGLVELEEKRKEAKQLTENNMAPARRLKKVEREIALLKKKQALIRKDLPLERKRITREIELLKKQSALLRERLPLERELFKEKLSILKTRLKNPVKKAHVTKEAALTAPISGHVIWVHPDLREGAEMNRNTAVLRVGVMDPMLVRARVHEIEAVKCKVGDRADFSTKSIPGRTFEARVSRLSWASINPALEKPSYYEVEFEVGNPDFVLREGLRGRIVFRKSKKNRK